MKKTNGDARPTKPARDPDIAQLVKATGNKTNADIYHKTYLSRGTINRLRETRADKPKTTYPSHVTMVGIAAAIGRRWKLV